MYSVSEQVDILSHLSTNIEHLSLYEASFFSKEFFQNKISELYSQIGSVLRSFCLIDRHGNIDGVLVFGKSMWDSDQFKIPIGKIYLASFSPGLKMEARKVLVKELVKHAMRTDLKVIFTRIDLRDYPTIQAFESEGAILTDVLLTLSLRVEECKACRIKEDFRARKATDAHKERLANIASRIFHTHFHADPFLLKDKANEVYSKWIVQDVDKKDKIVLVAEVDDEIVGFVSLRMLEVDRAAQIELIGLSPTHSKKGISRFLIASAVKLLPKECVLYVRTQAFNTPALCLYTGIGFRPVFSQATLHTWLSRR